MYAIRSYYVKGKKLSKEHKGMGFRETATQFLMAEREQLLRDAKTDPDAMITYRMKRKQFPLTYDDSWVGGTGDIGFDYEILDKQLAEVRITSYNVCYTKLLRELWSLSMQK